MNSSTFNPTVVPVPRGLRVSTKEIPSSRCALVTASGVGVPRWPAVSSRLIKCTASSPTTPDSTVDLDEVGSVPRFDIFEEPQVVTIGEKKCRVFSAKGVTDRVGTVVFLSGFAQTPEAYKGLLERCASAGIVVLAPLTSTLSTSRSRLQENLVNDGEFWIERAIDDSHPDLKQYLPRGKGKGPVGILGHSVGGGLSYALAARIPQAQSIATMSPFPSLSKGFNPAEVIEGNSFQASSRRALVLAGGLDLYSRAKNVDSDIVTPLTKALGEAAVECEFLKFGLHTVYQDFIDFPLEEIVADFLKEPETHDAFLTGIREFPGLLAGRLFMSGLRFEMAIAAAVYAYGAFSDTTWLEWGAGGAMIVGLSVAGIVEVIKRATGQPDKSSEKIARFFLDGFQ